MMESIIVVCEDCGKKYRINLAKVPEGKDTFNCLACEHIVPIPKIPEAPTIPESITESFPDSFPQTESISAELLNEEPTLEAAPFETTDEMEEATTLQDLQMGKSVLDLDSVTTDTIESEEEMASGNEIETEISINDKPFFMKGLKIGLSAKLSLFVIVPLILAFAFAALFSLRQMTNLGDKITKDSLTMVTKMAEKEIVEYTKAVALQVDLFLQNHPELKKEDFQRDPEFKKIAVQRLSLTMRGFTSLYDVSLISGRWRYWSHIDPKFVNKNTNEIKPLLRNGYDGFERLMSAGKNGNVVSGYYKLKDNEGRERDNFMALVPVKGTTLYVSSTAYFDESTLGVVPQPMSQAFKEYLEMVSWPQDKNWWKNKY